MTTGIVGVSDPTPGARQADEAHRDHLAGLRVLASARWPETDTDTEPPPVAGFTLSSFSPLVAEVAERCLRRRYGAPPVPPRHSRTAVVLLSVLGDVTTAAVVAQAVEAGRRVAPLLFFQSVPNTVVGHVAVRWGLTGPVVCVSPNGPPEADGATLAATLLADGDADEVLVVLAEPARGPGTREQAAAMLVSSVEEKEEKQ